MLLRQHAKTLLRANGGALFILLLLLNSMLVRAQGNEQSGVAYELQLSNDQSTPLEPLNELHSNLPTQCAAQQCTGVVPTSFAAPQAATPTRSMTRGSNSQIVMPHNLLLADIDADGASDFVQYADGNIFVHKTDFEQTEILHLTIQPSIKRIITGDFHSLQYNQTCVILVDNSFVCYGTSPGHRELWWWFTQGSFIGDNEDTIVGEFDGDGREDILVYPRGGGKIRLYSIKGDFFFENTPSWIAGNLEGPLDAGLQLRAGDVSGDGRDDLVIVGPAGEAGRYDTAFDGTNHTFWWAFTTSGGFVGPDDQITLARIDDNTADDVILRNRQTGITRFFQPEYVAGTMAPIPDIPLGQINTDSNSLLFWGFMHGSLNEPGANNRDDAIVYDLTNDRFVRSNARWDGNILTYWWAYTQAPPSNQLALHVERLRVDYQDDGFLGGGDEPYLIVVGFRSRFKTPNSTFTFWSEYLEDNWADGVKAGAERSVPLAMGQFDLPGISLATMDDVASGRQFPELTGALVLAMESDGTPFGAIRDKINSDLRPAMEAELRRLIENGELDLAHLEGEALQQAIKTVESATAVKFWDGLSLWLQSFGDPDDKISKHLFAYLAVAPDLQKLVPVKQEAGLTFGPLQDQQFAINNNAVIFEGDGSKYQVTVSVRSSAKDWGHHDPVSCARTYDTISRSFLPFISSSGNSATPNLTKPLKVLQYNVQFLTPWEGEPISDEHWPNSIERATNIGKALACYDVVVLNETVNPQRRQEILAAMNTEASKCGKPDLIPGDSYFDVVAGPSIEGSLPTSATDAVGKLFAAPGKPVMGDEVMIISRLPIIQTDSQVYNFSANEDRLAAKGVLHARLQGSAPFPNNPIDVFATHLQADESSVRTCQIGELASYIRTHTTPQNTLLLLGDFNIDGAFAEQSDVNSQYTYMNNTWDLLGNGHALQDIGQHLSSGTNHDPNHPENDLKRRIDYIFASGPGVVVNLQQVKIIDFADPSGQKSSLSDHAAVEATINAK